MTFFKYCVLCVCVWRRSFDLIIAYFFSKSNFRFWYISLVACYRDNVTCTWRYYDAKRIRAESKSNTTNDNKNHRYNTIADDYEISYDIRLVNGNPNQSSSNPLTFQFSFDQQNILEMNLIFVTVYLILVPIQIYAVRIQRHPVTKLFTLSLILEFVSLVFMLSYYIRYTIGGIGSDTVKTIGDILDILSRVSAPWCTFIHIYYSYMDKWMTNILTKRKIYDYFITHKILKLFFSRHLCWYYCYWPKDGPWHGSKSQNQDGYYLCQFGYHIVLFTSCCTCGIE